MKWMGWLLTTAVFLLIFVATAQAHGGGELFVGNAPVGAYKVSVWVNPPQPRADETVHLTVGIAGENDAPVLDAQVEIVLRPTGSESVAATAAATTEQSINRLFYETDFPPVDPGRYDVQVAVTGADGAGAVDFSLEIRPSGGVNWLLVGLIGVGVVGVGVLYWSWRTGTQTAVAPRQPVKRR